MNGSTYFLQVADFGSGEILAYVHGDLDVIGYVGKRAIKAIQDDRQYAIQLAETQQIGPGQDFKRTVTEFTGDGDIAATVLKKKLAAERAQQSASTPAQPVDTSAEHVHIEI
jgi:hypothetical protein